MPDRQPKTDSLPAPAAACPETIALSLDPMVQLLKQLRDLAVCLDAGQYNLKPESTKCGAIGGHIRHTLDHVGAWLCGVNQETINYDDRERGTDIETNPQTAVKVIDSYMDKLADIQPATLLDEVAVFTSMNSDGALMRLPSTHAPRACFCLQPHGPPQRHHRDHRPRPGRLSCPTALAWRLRPSRIAMASGMADVHSNPCGDGGRLAHGV